MVKGVIVLLEHRDSQTEPVGVKGGEEEVIIIEHVGVYLKLASFVYLWSVKLTPNSSSFVFYYYYYLAYCRLRLNPKLCVSNPILLQETIIITNSSILLSLTENQ